DDKWELQWSKDPNFVTDVQSSDKGTYVSKYSMETGATYYVRAITYKYGAKGIEYGTPSNIVTIVKAKEPTASNLVLAEKTRDGYIFKYTGNIKLPNSGIQLWISKDPGFTNNPSLTKLRKNSDGEEQFTLYNSYFEPGHTYYVRIRPYSEDSSLEDSNKADETWYGAFSNTVTVSPKVSDVNVTAEVASTSVALTATAEDPSYATGYQFQKKVGKKYQNLGKTTDGIYTDKKLTANTAYSYRVRAYYVSEKTGKVSYGAWKTYTTLTWGGNLNLKAVAKGKTSVKLTWNKLKGAQGYEVFRTVTDSYGKSYSADQGRTNTYEKWTLVKDIKKASAKTYTVKRLAAGQDYRFKVRAYKVVNGKKYYIESEDSCTLDFALWIVSSKQNANGTLKLTWNPVYAGNGYLIEKKNQDTGVWEAYKTITRAATSSFTFPAANGQTDTYRIRAYKNGNPKTYTEDYSFEVDPYLAAPTGVKATVNKADGSITVKWNPVAGADYYEVYRTTRAASTYNKDTKTYSYSYGYANRLDNWVVDANSKYGYKVSDEKLTATTTTDRKVSYVNGNGIEQTWYEGPKAGVKYYYYVVAVKNGTAYAVKDSGKTIESGNSAAAAATVTNVTVAKTKITSGKATKGKVTLKWKKVAGAAGYEVYRSTKKGSGYTKLATITKGSTVKLTDKTVKAGKKYYYKVRAYKTNEAGVDVYAAYSAVKTVKAK
ncbi:MAG: fibronectin type III domain-containing protein, partial [Blautia sp.]|nr:fibronectin type III domain-containing protein [Blautia sp.]